MKFRFSLVTLAIILSGSIGNAAAAGKGDVAFVQLMVNMQYFTHKLGLAIDAGNYPLAGFYVHEVEETLETLESVEQYQGYPIGSIARSKLAQPFERLEQAIKQKQDASSAYDALIDGCNKCHDATGREYLRIVRNPNNHYMQSFEAQ